VCEAETRGHPVEFRIMGFQPVSTEDDIVGANVSDIEFGAFLIVVSFGGLDCHRVNRFGFIQRTINIFDRQGGFQCLESKSMFLSKGSVNDHAFSTAIEEGRSTDLLLRPLTDKGHSKHDKRRMYIANHSLRYRLGVKSV
jgi:hypothetical protein